MAHGTRYHEGDIVKVDGGTYPYYEVIGVYEKSGGEGPDYELVSLDSDGENSIIRKASDLEILDKTVVEEYNTFSEAEQELKEEFREFENTGEPFFWEAEVYGPDGSHAVINVDFSTAFEDDFRGVANVIAFKDQQAEDIPGTKEFLMESDAVMAAENMIKRAAGELSYYRSKSVKPRINAEYEDRGDSITGFIDIQWRQMSEMR